MTDGYEQSWTATGPSRLVSTLDVLLLDRVLRTTIPRELEDYDLGLWELVSMLNRDDLAHLDIEFKVALARTVVFDLLDKRRISLWRADGWPPRVYQPTTPTEVDLLRTDGLPWTDPAPAAMLIAIRPQRDGQPLTATTTAAAEPHDHFAQLTTTCNWAQTRRIALEVWESLPAHAAALTGDALHRWTDDRDGRTFTNAPTF